MARYIDADKIDYTVTMVGMDENAGYRAVAFESDIDAMPTADVAPRAEVEYWKEQCFNACMNNGCLDKAIVKAAVAREIFEEIERIFDQHTEGGYYLNGVWFHKRLDLDTREAIAELKNKYAEEQTDGN